MSNLFSLIELQPGDMPSLHALWKAAAEYDPCSSQPLHEKIFGDPDVKCAGRVGALLNDSLVGACVGVVRTTTEGDRGFIKLVAVDPKFQRAGIGTQLLRAVEQHLVTAGVTTLRVAESAPNYLSPGIDERNEPCRAFFASHGYEVIGEAVNQSVDLVEQTLETNSQERSLAAAGISIRRAARADRFAIHQFLAQHWPTWSMEVDRALANNPVTLHIALAGADVLGFAAHDANNVGTGWFGPMGTAPEFRGRRIGEVLLKRCLADTRVQGLTKATIPWVGPTEFYERTVNAKVSSRFVRLEKELPTTDGFAANRPLP